MYDFPCSYDTLLPKPRMLTANHTYDTRSVTGTLPHSYNSCTEQSWDFHEQRSNQSLTFHVICKLCFNPREQIRLSTGYIRSTRRLCVYRRNAVFLTAIHLTFTSRELKELARAARILTSTEDPDRCDSRVVVMFSEVGISTKIVLLRSANSFNENV